MRAWFLVPVVFGLVLLGLYAGEMLQRERGEGLNAAQQGSGASARVAGVAGSGAVVGPMTLSGPRGATVQIPDSRPRIVNVWLQACPDCMPRFEASRDLVQRGAGWPETPINVAYGQANAAWAERYGVADDLVVDVGSNLVNVLGIRTFTTLVIDTEGRVVHTDFVDREGFHERVTAALTSAGALATPPPASPSGTPTAPAPPADGAQPLEDPRVLAGLTLLFLGVVAGGLTLSLRRDEAGAGGGIQPWQEALVAGGRRCSGCAGRFDEPEATTRCPGCETPYHRTCAERSPSCQTAGCGRRVPTR